MSRYLVGLVGEGISASLTPAMHMTEAAILGLDYEYTILDLSQMEESPDDIGLILERAKSEGYAALNVTYPLKQSIIPYLDELSPAAAQIEAVNLVIIEGERTIGHNTDWSGFRSAVIQGLGTASLSTVFQIGAGGAGAATAYALLSLGVGHLVIGDLRVERARLLSDSYRAFFPGANIEIAGPEDFALRLSSVDGVVHATPVGMLLHPGLAFPVESLAADAWVADIVYRPIETELLGAARARGHRVLDGGLMAVGQAAESLAVITGRQPDAARMRAHFLVLLRNERSPVGRG